MNSLMSSTDYAEQFEANKDRLAGSENSWLLPLREAAIQRFTSQGIPNRKDEEWRYCNFKAVASTEFELTPVQPEEHSSLDPSQYWIPNSTGPKVVFVDGNWSQELSDLGTLDSGIELRSIRELLSSESGSEDCLEQLHAALVQADGVDDSALVSLNSALFADGLFLWVKKGVQFSSPIQVLHWQTAAAVARSTSCKSILIADDNSVSNLVEIFATEGDQPLFNTFGYEVTVGENSKFDHYAVHREAESATFFGNERVEQKRSSTYGNHFFALGEGLIRNQVETTLGGEGSHTDLNGLYVAEDKNTVDSHTIINHTHPHCTSWEMYRGVLAGEAIGNFLGKINVYQAAQKTDAKQSTSSLLLSKKATINARPCLEIYADDVKCTHGATIGQLDQDALFYMRARGIPFTEARSLLVHAFAAEVVETIENEDLQIYISELLELKIPRSQ